MAKRLFWLSSGYVAGATSSWWVQRKVKRTAQKVLPEAVRNEVATRVSAAGTRAADLATNSPVAQGARRAWQQVRPAEIDLTGAPPETRSLSVVDGGLADEPSRSRLRERTRRARN